MDDRTRVGLSTLLGAAAGAVLGYLYLTEDGRRLREQLEPGLNEVGDELRRIRRTVEKARQTALEGLATFDELTGATERTPSETVFRSSR